MSASVPLGTPFSRSEAETDLRVQRRGIRAVSARDARSSRGRSPLGITRAPSTLLVRGRLVRAEDQR